MVPRMLQFRRDMLSVLQNSFVNHAEFAQALKEGERPRAWALGKATGSYRRHQHECLRCTLLA